LSGNSRNNYRCAIGTLINFAVSRGYLVKGTVEIEDVAQAREESAEIEIFRPEEMAAVLKIANERLIPSLPGCVTWRCNGRIGRKCGWMPGLPPTGATARGVSQAKWLVMTTS
jgi:hypothetical protein